MTERMINDVPVSGHYHQYVKPDPGTKIACIFWNLETTPPAGSSEADCALGHTACVYNMSDITNKDMYFGPSNGNDNFGSHVFAITGDRVSIGEADNHSHKFTKTVCVAYDPFSCKFPQATSDGFTKCTYATVSKESYEAISEGHWGNVFVAAFANKSDVLSSVNETESDTEEGKQRLGWNGDKCVIGPVLYSHKHLYELHAISPYNPVFGIPTSWTACDNGHANCVMRYVSTPGYIATVGSITDTLSGEDQE